MSNVKVLVPIAAMVLIWCIGIAFGYFLAWMRFNRAYLMVDRERLKLNQPQVATQRPARCACCKETRRNETDTWFACDCAWAAEDLIAKRDDDHTCTMHKAAS